MCALPAKILAIGGSDPSGGAGILADAKTIHANAGYALCVVTAATSQNTRGVTGSFEVPAAEVRAQLRAIFEDLAVDAVKTGMLASAEIVEVVAEELAASGASNVVVDPVMRSSSGFTLLADSARELLRRRLLPLARLCTPNVEEAQLLSGLQVRDAAEAEDAARRILSLGPRAVLIKGGHLSGPLAMDLLLEGDRLEWLAAERLEGPGVHGSGCMLAAAIATRLARGEDLLTAVWNAKRYVGAVMRAALALGGGRPLGDHFFYMEGGDWMTGRRDAQ